MMLKNDTTTVPAMIGDAYLNPAPSDEEIIAGYEQTFRDIEKAIGSPPKLRVLLDIIERRTEERNQWRHRAHHVLDLFLELNPEMMPQEVMALLQEKQDFERGLDTLIDIEGRGIDILGELPGYQLDFMLVNASDPDREAIQSWARKLHDWALSVTRKGGTDEATANAA